MLRIATEDGWYLITHPDHARLAGEFAAHWGNALFLPPEPRAEVLHGIRVHDDGWAARDAHPQITREGKPSAFSEELVGKYSAFEEIDLADYLAVRESALAKVEGESAYAAMLVSMHTYNLLSVRADRSTIAPADLPRLDSFLEQQLARQRVLREAVRSDGHFAVDEISVEAIRDNFRLLQAVDNLSLLGCVGYTRPATLLHPLPTADGRGEEVWVESLGERRFRLAPYPIAEDELSVDVIARHVSGKVFTSATELQEKYRSAAEHPLRVTVCK